MATSNPKDLLFIKTFGENVRKKRLEKGLTIVQLAEKCNVEYTTISKIERGLINTTISMAKILSKALEVPVAELFGDI